MTDEPSVAAVTAERSLLEALEAGCSAPIGAYAAGAAQLLGLRGDLRCVPIRGNAGTRLAKVSVGELDAVVLAYAGLARIGQAGTVTQVFEPEEMLPAPGQGALAVECREDDAGLVAALQAVTDEASVAAVTAERSLLEALEAGCSAPIGAYAAGAAQLRMQVAVMSPDGSRVLRAHGEAAAAGAWQLGRDLAAELLRSGASDLIGGPEEQANSRNDVQ